MRLLVAVAALLLAVAVAQQDHSPDVLAASRFGATLANDQSLPRQGLSRFADGFRAGRDATFVRPLLSDAQYAELLRRQNDLGQMLDLSKIARPGIGDFQKGETFISQGAGRWEKMPSRLPSGKGPMFDIFLPEGSQLPAGSRVLQRNVPGRTVSIANQLSSRGAAGSNPILVDFITDGKTFQRVQVPVDSLRAGTSESVWRGCSE